MVVFKHKGSFKNIEKFLKGAEKLNYRTILESYGEKGVRALSDATPVDSGLTASSWDYTISMNKNSFYISWTNSNVNDGVPVAILLQYGHGTRNGGYVQGRDYINPAIKPILDKIADEAWKEISNL